jgi:hypothetical protein
MATELHHDKRPWIIAALMVTASLCLVLMLALGLMQIWIPSAGINSDYIVSACIGRAAGSSWWGVWWSVPSSNTFAQPMAFASAQAVCAYVPRPPFLAERGTMTLLH